MKSDSTVGDGTVGDGTVGESDTVAEVTVRGAGEREDLGGEGGLGRSVEIMAKCGGKTDCQIRDLRFVELSAVEGGCDPEPCWGLGYTRLCF